MGDPDWAEYVVATKNLPKIAAVRFPRASFLFLFSPPDVPLQIYNTSRLAPEYDSVFHLIDIEEWRRVRRQCGTWPFPIAFSFLTFSSPIFLSFFCLLSSFLFILLLYYHSILTTLII